MQPHDWSRFHLRLPINADRQTIFRYWTNQHDLEQWFLRKAEFRKPDKTLRDRSEPIRVGDTYEWMWHGWPDEVIERGTVMELGPLHLKFSFGKGGNVTVTVNEEMTTSILELIQDDIPTDET